MKQFPILLALGAVLMTLAATPRVPAATAASSATQVEAELRDLNEQISAAGTQVQKNRRQLAEVENELRGLDRASAEANTRAHQLNLKVGEMERLIAATGTEIEAVQSAMKAQRSLLESHTRALHQLGDSNPLRHIFGGSDVVETERALLYFGYLARARQAVIESSVALTAELTTLQAEQQTEQENRRQARDRIAKERAKLQKLAGQRRTLVTELRSQGATAKARLAALEADRLQLAALLEELSFGTDTIVLEPFGDRRGSLPWPLTGNLRQAYGKGTVAGRPNRSGWFISAAEGTPVYPVHSGRVAFAGWFRGLGYLTIVDHGNEIMTLYGHAGNLLLAVEDQARPGQPLAVAGSSGGTVDSGVYFELRISGNATDPAGWLRRPGA